MTLNASSQILSKLCGKNYLVDTGTASSNSARIRWNGTISNSIGGTICTKDTVGALPFYNAAVSEETKIAGISLFSDVPSYFILIDRLWECSVNTSGLIFDITSSATQIIDSVTWPARDSNESTNGEGVYLAIVSNGAWSSGVVDIVVNYTNSSGVPNRVGNSIFALTANPINRHIVYISLDSGDTGVRSLQSFNLSFGFNPIPTAGTFHLIAFRPISIYTLLNNYNPVTESFAKCPLPKLYNDSCLTFISQPQASAAEIQPFSGYIEYASG